MSQLQKKLRQRKALAKNGFSMTEMVVSVSAGTLLVLGSGVALRSTGSLIEQTKDKTTLRQNTTNGMRLMRSEIERSMHLILDRDPSDSPDDDDRDLNNSDYTRVKTECQNLSTGNFKPIFGAKLIELVEPVIYGITTSSNKRGYTLQRCGSALNAHGRYQENQTLFLSPILDDIAALPCTTNLVDRDECPEAKPLENILQSIDFRFSDGKTPIRSVSEPAFRVETDENSKLIKFIDPTDNDDIDTVYLQKVNSENKSTTILPTYFAAFARADKRINGNGISGNGGILNGAFFKNIASKRLRFVVDGSGSMSACVMWGDGYGNKRTYYDPSRRMYIRRRRNCAFTRMEAMQSELTNILNDLSEDTRIGLHSFSTTGSKNNKSWGPSANTLVKISDPGMRESAIQFVNSLDDHYPTSWGGTDPWDAIETAFNDPETDTLYLLSDGQPNNDPWGGSWRSDDYGETAQFYSKQNNNRMISLKVNTTALGLSSTWMQQLSEKTNGDYNQVDQDSLQGDDIAGN